MRQKKDPGRETTYKSKELVVGYQVMLLRSQNKTQIHLISPVNPSLKIDAHDESEGLHSTFDLKLADNMALELHQETTKIPALLDGHPIGPETRQLDHGSVLQFGDEILKIRKIEVKLGAQGLGTQLVYSSNRRLGVRQSVQQWGIRQGLWMFTILFGAVLFGILIQ